MTETQSEEAIADADRANDRYLAAVRYLEYQRNGESMRSENQNVVAAIDAVIFAAKDARIAEETAIRLNFNRLAQQSRIRESHRVWNELIHEYDAQRTNFVPGTAEFNAQSDRNSESVAKPDSSPEDDSVAGNFCLVGGGLVAIGAFFPYFVETSVLGTVDRNAFQLGAFFSMTYQGPFIVITGVLLILRGLTLKEVIGTKSEHPWSPLEWSPLVLSVIAAVAVLDAWLGTSSNPDVTFNRGFGGIVSLVGVLFGFVAMYLHRRNLR